MVDSPPLKISLLSSEGVSSFLGPPNFETDPNGVNYANATILEFSNDGELVAVQQGDRIIIANTSTGAELSSFEHAGIKMIAFSPKGSYLQTWQYAAQVTSPEQQPPDNLIVWNTATGQRVMSWLQKNFSSANWPSIKWTDDETVSARMVSNEIRFFAGVNFNTVTRVLKLPGVAYFSWAPGPVARLVAFVGEKKGQAAAAKMYELPNVSQVRLHATIMRAQSCEAVWNKQGDQCLVITQTDFDATGKSYYGDTGVYLLNSNDGTARNVKPGLDKEGPIYQCVWCPTGDKFVVIFGSMPSRTTLFNTKLEPLIKFPLAHRNTAFFSPNGHILAIAGFGNLQGNIDLWDIGRGKLMATFQSPCSAGYQWSPCSNYILTAILTPRLRQDNGWKVWTTAGNLLFHQPVTELYQANWRPTSADRYPNVPPKRSQILNVAQQEVAPAPKKYVPPHQRNAAAAAPAPEPKKDLFVAEVLDPATGKPKAQAQAGAPSKNSAKNRKRREKKKQLEAAAAAAGNSAPASSAPAEAEPAQAAPEPESAASQDTAKKVKALNKKLRQIEQLKEQQGQGKPMNPQQLEKLASEEAIRAELKGLAN